MEYLPLFKTNKERKVFFLSIFLLFIFNIYLLYQDYKKFTLNEVYNTNGTILNIYEKEKYNILKIKSKKMTFFTSTQKNTNLNIFDNINIYLVSQNVSFYSYLKGLYLKSFSIQKNKSLNSKKNLIHNYIYSQHKNKDIASLYAALFIATPLSPEIRELSSNLGISHLIAISGFHLGVISFVLYTILHFLYSKLHQSYLPYRNKKYDIMIITTCILFVYLIFLDIPPSLLRAFVMLVFTLFLFRNNIKIISFETLFIISLLIIALFPKLLFSLSLWFSIAGVFYIFLFLQYFHTLNKFIQIILFNFWIYMAINPITHYFFATTSLEQLYSPILTLLFTVFYPITAILHILSIGDILDGLVTILLTLEIKTHEILTSQWLFYSYIILSILSIKSQKIFILLNLIIISYGFWLFRPIF